MLQDAREGDNLAVAAFVESVVDTLVLWVVGAANPLQGAVGFGFALVIFSGIREKLAYADPPRCFRGMAIALVTGGLLSLAFMGFSGLVKLPY